MPPNVNARIPLSLLEAIRRIDTPEDTFDTEYVPELRNKRFGLSDTVYTQIRRYNDALKRGQPIPFAEAEGLGTLIGRRPDAEALFQNAGRILARQFHESISSSRRGAMEALPGFVSRAMALKQINVMAAKYLGGKIDRTGAFLTLKVPHSVTVNSAPNSAGCGFYEAALGEIMELLTGTGDQIDHALCTQRNDPACEWRARWQGTNG